MVNHTLPTRTDEQRPSTRNVQRHPSVVFQPMDAGAILVNMDTDRIYELNATATRLWDLLDTASSIQAIQQQMLSEFDVDEAILEREIGRTIDFLARSGLVVVSEDGARVTS